MTPEVRPRLETCVGRRPETVMIAWNGEPPMLLVLLKEQGLMIRSTYPILLLSKLKNDK